jgi:hypothetical protein
MHRGSCGMRHCIVGVYRGTEAANHRVNSVCLCILMYEFLQKIETAVSNQDMRAISLFST